ncbi:formate dehydrogenase accessory sulfurtransferase FdhD [Sphingobium sufflavum]|uniref:formate dehydrogenase accessory sulfurtransferase FdhD n=1 Tax=Sphingobium sufflavum TaxID=1129547 RepID=UPI001F43DDA3|nr:formate dehydrogenase accessory sulfurtransferase FdhD [Sphingobium sufflavum]MCE7797267.1 formate dehydrogenase accessory sulfurtransferase FdhD [Sphingobium sufflavum]
MIEVDDEPLPAGPSTSKRFDRIAPDAAAVPLFRDVAEEVPVAMEINGIGYAVLMASPVDLEDLAHGFLLTERLVTAPQDILSVDIHRQANGIVMRISAPPHVAAALIDRVRHRTSDSSCGLCGIENLEQAMRPLPRVANRSAASHTAVFAALGHLRAKQSLNRATGAVHAAAACDARGVIRLVREDVGRHNAFDKLIGAMRRGGMSWDGGFALLSSRCSYELVEKAVLGGCPMLVTISAGTALALRRAETAGLDLRVLARPDAMLVPGPVDPPYSAAVA